MNTSSLKRFAQSARRKLMEQVGAKLDYILSSDSAELREKSRQIEELRKDLKHTGKAELVEKVAYTWFNRLVALRYMDVNDYQPCSIRVITPTQGYTQPQAITEAKQGNIPTEWKLDREKVFDLLDGRIPASNPQNEAFRLMLVAACNHLSTVFPFLFEKIDDYSELLLPDDLTSPFSIVHDVIEGMLEEDCKAIEVIGWLYQFYISERKDEVFASKSKVKKEDIPAATQLFTPRWIVEYMVQNTVGRLWLLNRPNSRLKDHMLYYIDPVEAVTDFLKISSPTEITLLDQACGSGHILVYGFDLLYKIYEEEGYNPSEIPSLIIGHNLSGFEIDPRAAQLAGFALMMKTREYNRRVFKKDMKPNILCFQDFELTVEETGRLLKEAGIDATGELLSDLDLMRKATNFGSLIQPKTKTPILESAHKKAEAAYLAAGLFDKNGYLQLLEVLQQLTTLTKKVTCVVDNPPYMGGGNMNKELSDFVRDNYTVSKADLMACFMECGLAALKSKGYLGMINQHSWMFLSSYEKLRQKLIENIHIATLLHLGPRTFPEIGGEVVQNAAFTFVNDKSKFKGIYLKLSDFAFSEEKQQKTIEALSKSSCEWFYIVNQTDFENIPGSPLAFWTKDFIIEIFESHKSLKNYAHPSKGMMPGPRFIRFTWEVKKDELQFGVKSHQESEKSDKTWYPYFKGGEFRKWYGNRDYFVNFYKDGIFLKENDYGERNPQFYFKNQLNWTKVTGGQFSMRIGCEGALYDDAACQCPIINENDIYYLLGYLNTKLSKTLLNSISLTLNYSPGELGKIPILYNKDIFPVISNLTLNTVKISKDEWDSHETSWDFKFSELLSGKRILIDNMKFQKNDKESLELLFNHYCKHWTGQFMNLHQDEEEINRIFIEKYCLQDEISSDVPIEEITILQQELDRDALKQLNQKLKRDPFTLKVLNYHELELPFDAREVMAQLVSYVVGCMFGRYSLDKPGLILANQGETLEDYMRIIGEGSSPLEKGGQGGFLPDEDNVIPVLDDDWFEDDITGRFRQFLKASFGEEHFRENLQFVEECLGRDIRSYFARDFYADHVRRYKKRPIYWMFSSPRGSFNVLIYMHRYTPDTVSHILNGYLRQYQEKLRMRKLQLQHVQVTGTNTERTQALRETERIEQVLMELHGYERDILYPLAAERISIDLDDGVLVNYNRFGKAVKEIAGLNDPATKKKVKEFDWVDTGNIH